MQGSDTNQRGGGSKGGVPREGLIGQGGAVAAWAARLAQTEYRVFVMIFIQNSENQTLGN